MLKKRKRGEHISRKHIKIKRQSIVNPDVVSFVMGTRCTGTVNCNRCPKYSVCRFKVSRELSFIQRIRNDVIDFLEKSRMIRGPDLCLLGINVQEADLFDEVYGERIKMFERKISGE